MRTGVHTGLLLSSVCLSGVDGVFTLKCKFLADSSRLLRGTCSGQ